MKLEYAPEAKLPKPLLLFQGGGYEGCFWEWNILVMTRDEDGIVFVDDEQKFVSGRRGALVADLARSNGILVGAMAALGRKSYYHRNDDLILIVNRVKDWIEMCSPEWEGCRNVLKLLAAELAEDMQGTNHFSLYYIPCPDCGCMTDPRELYYKSYQGCGGIAIQMTGLCCRDCHDEAHYEWVANEWPRLSLKERKEAWDKAIDYYDVDPKDLPLMSIRRDEMPDYMPAEAVYENEYY